ncbi:tRNA (guanine37-N1)-methyltransferase [Mycoplasmoides fastidiosum]|uniref:tRNA (guanine-N(1)-)-methyltransferase n=1 Tax=Mycoplasmoides fastidiosum TaxID=92758 RepID=A0ABU0LZR6_9BACT|nr:tRNA (guanosine(37)-N1)-methyltransferase TrmD [Mycoplasmoides fastidiosum]MDQ0514189.1 tRNA (guanine37-N1)-methyltransferase [Mycoplasmoides fastidiosum]UUD37399.1 tRNA (guanosine(37)-N1)-methyltransferase TrmD [Mycoplasmoides fastidiosum]
MKRFYFCTLFPEIIQNYASTSIIKQAQYKELIAVHTLDFRDFTNGNYRQVDDYQYGGGAGMVLMPEPIAKTLQAIPSTNQHVILLSPRGQRFDQKKAIELAQLNKDLVFLCGHYEGFDERINHYVNEYLSVGDFVLTSGGLAGLICLDAIVRLIPSVINSDSLVSESFNDYLLDHPVYTKPQIFENQAVPDILLSGHHANIATYRLNERIRLTQKYRPDLYELYLKNNKLLK